MKKNKTDIAKRHSKEHFDYECVFCLSSNVDGCHIFPAGNTRYEQFAALKYNIVPCCNKDHDKHLDNNSGSKKTRPWQRIRMLLKYAHPDKKHAVREWLEILHQILKEYKLQNVNIL